MYNRVPEYDLPSAGVVEFLAVCARLDPITVSSTMTDFRLTRDVALPAITRWFPSRFCLKATFIVLEPSAQIVVHVDPPILGTRHHVPLQTNEDCWTYHDGTWEQLALGECYTMDPTLPHGAVNWGSRRRIHLILDLQ